MCCDTRNMLKLHTPVSSGQCEVRTDEIKNKKDVPAGSLSGPNLTLCVSETLLHASSTFPLSTSWPLRRKQCNKQKTAGTNFIVWWVRVSVSSGEKSLRAQWRRLTSWLNIIIWLPKMQNNSMTWSHFLNKNGGTEGCACTHKPAVTFTNYYVTTVCSAQVFWVCRVVKRPPLYKAWALRLR